VGGLWAADALTGLPRPYPQACAVRFDGWPRPAVSADRSYRNFPFESLLDRVSMRE